MLRKIQVMTVDSFQGSEADIVFLSFVRSNLKSKIGFLNDPQRLNVALTRAKFILLIFGSSRTLENSENISIRNLIYDSKYRRKFFDFSKDVEIDLSN